MSFPTIRQLIAAPELASVPLAELGSEVEQAPDDLLGELAGRLLQQFEAGGDPDTAFAVLATLLGALEPATAIAIFPEDAIVAALRSSPPFQELVVSSVVARGGEYLASTQVFHTMVEVYFETPSLGVAGAIEQCVALLVAVPENQLVRRRFKSGDIGEVLARVAALDDTPANNTTKSRLLDLQAALVTGAGDGHWAAVPADAFATDDILYLDAVIRFLAKVVAVEGVAAAIEPYIGAATIHYDSLFHNAAVVQLLAGLSYADPTDAAERIARLAPTPELLAALSLPCLTHFVPHLESLCESLAVAAVPPVVRASALPEIFVHLAPHLTLAAITRLPFPAVVSVASGLSHQPHTAEHLLLRLPRVMEEYVTSTRELLDPETYALRQETLSNLWLLHRDLLETSGWAAAVLRALAGADPVPAVAAQGA